MTESRAMRRPTRKNAHPPAWASLPHESLLDLRLKDLDLQVKGTWLETSLEALNDELHRSGVPIRAHAWISDEWFSPDNTPGIAFPFYLAHPRLMRLERKMMFNVEGGTRRECMQILRHEAGHVVQHSYGLHRRKRWQELFGRSSKIYPSSYRPDPGSKDFVQHLRRWYAQSHPDEDFAETFAVWLTPRSAWRKRYANWGAALEKLTYVDELMDEIAGIRPHLTKRIEVDAASYSTTTLREHYEKKLAHCAIETHAPYDRDLQHIFSNDARHASAPPAAGFIRRNRAEIIALVQDRLGEYEPTFDAVLDELADRCRVLKLRAPGSERQIRVKLTALLTAKTANALYTSSRRQWFAV